MNINENRNCAKTNIMNAYKRKKIENVKLKMRNYINYYNMKLTLRGECGASIRTALKLKIKSSKNK